tara:strand:- start:288 stop:1064 length:777 start_codon:yes stop_codon:yes gene_type:complete
MDVVAILQNYQGRCKRCNNVRGLLTKYRASKVKNIADLKVNLLKPQICGRCYKLEKEEKETETFGGSKRAIHIRNIVINKRQFLNTWKLRQKCSVCDGNCTKLAKIEGCRFILELIQDLTKNQQRLAYVMNEIQKALLQSKCICYYCQLDPAPKSLTNWAAQTTARGKLKWNCVKMCLLECDICDTSFYRQQSLLQLGRWCPYCNLKRKREGIQIVADRKKQKLSHEVIMSQRLHENKMQNIVEKQPDNSAATESSTT